MTAGGGLISQTGDPPVVALSGSYQFVSANNNPYGQYDDVELRFTSSYPLALLVGGGFTQAVTSRSGVRAEARVYLAADNVSVVMNTFGGTYPESRRSTYRFEGAPSIQISTDGRGSTLGGPVGVDWEVATGSGTRVLYAFTAGYCWRF